MKNFRIHTFISSIIFGAFLIGAGTAIIVNSALNYNYVTNLPAEFYYDFYNHQNDRMLQDKIELTESVAIICDEFYGDIREIEILPDEKLYNEVRIEIYYQGQSGGLYTYRTYRHDYTGDGSVIACALNDDYRGNFISASVKYILKNKIIIDKLCSYRITAIKIYASPEQVELITVI